MASTVLNLPCPRCNTTVVPIKPGGNKRTLYQETIGRTKEQDCYINCDCGLRTISCDTPEDAIEQWKEHDLYYDDSEEHEHCWVQNVKKGK